MKLKIKVAPGSSRNQILGWHDDSVKIAVIAPPERGKANKVVIKLLADFLGLKKNDIVIISGQSASIKVLEISNHDEMKIFNKLKSLK